MFNWLTATKRPRTCGGEISAMYRGATTEAPPIASPPTNRKTNSDVPIPGQPQPNAETKYSTASHIRDGLRPSHSAGFPATSEPTIVPISALATVNPSSTGVRPKRSTSISVVPEITTVSKPNRKPASAATSVLPSK